MATIKYNSDGVQQWVARYGEADGDDNRALGIGMDGSGNIYVSGYEGRYEYVTVKYDPDGNPLWSVDHDIQSDSWVTPHAAVVNDRGEVFIAGDCNGPETGYDFITVKFTPDGFHEWEARFNGKNREEGAANDLFVDDNGNIYVTGYSCHNFITVKYDSEGSQLWKAVYGVKDYDYGHRNLLAVDRLCNVFMVCASRQDSSDWDFDFVTIKYNSNGVQQWVARYDEEAWPEGGNRWNIPKAVVTDYKGNVYVTGRSRGEGGGYDIVTIKYNSDGSEKWVNRYASVQHADAEVSDMAIDVENNIYVSGTVSGEESKLVTIKYNDWGEQKWMKTYGEPGTFFGSLIELDDWGNVYILSNKDKNSRLSAVANPDNCIILKYDLHGRRQWLRRCGDTGNPFIAGNIETDIFGNIFICGSTREGNLSDPFITQKYDANGIELWTRTNNSGQWGYPTCLAVDRHGNAYIAGVMDYANTQSDILILKYNPQGDEKWAIDYNDPRNTRDTANKLAIDFSGNVYVAGSARGKYWSQFKTIKFSQTEEDSSVVPLMSGFELFHNIPNPFRKQTLIYFVLPQSGHVTFNIFNQLGQKVYFKDLGQRQEGKQGLYFLNENLPSGIYYYQLRADGFVKTRKMAVVH